MYNCIHRELNSGRQRNLTAMRDQNFQQLMNESGSSVYNDSHDSRPQEEQAIPCVGASKQPIVEEIDSQLAFKEFLKRNLTHRKPSAEFIKSIQERIKLIDSDLTV